MRKYHLILFLAVLFLVPLITNGAMRAGTVDGSEQWGYVEVRPKAHMFWWYYKSPQRLKIQTSHGQSFCGCRVDLVRLELDLEIFRRLGHWILISSQETPHGCKKLISCLWIYSPVGTGYSFVEFPLSSFIVRYDEGVAEDLITLLISLFNKDKVLQKSPLYVVGESYGGKWAVLGLSALKAIEAGKLKLKLGGIVLGNTWLSPLLKDVSRLDNKGVEECNSLTQKIKQHLENENYYDAYLSWGELEDVIDTYSNSVDFYNFLLDFELDPLYATSVERSQKVKLKRNSRYLASSGSLSGKAGDDLNTLMNVVLRDKLKIIPDDVQWGGQARDVSLALYADFMRPRINEVDVLLAKGINVIIYSGQLDLICSTKGTEAWVGKLKWEGIQTFLSMDRTPLYCEGEKDTKGFTKSYKNLHFYWILNAGHYVPVDQPCVPLNMLDNIMHY